MAFFFGRNMNNRNVNNRTINNRNINKNSNLNNNNLNNSNLNNSNLNNNNLNNSNLNNSNLNNNNLNNSNLNNSNLNNSNLNNSNLNNNSDINQGVNFQPLTEEDLLKINEEIQENIKLNNLYLENKKANSNINNINNNNNNNIITPPKPSFNPNSTVIISYLHDFIQNEKNSNAFYENLADYCNIKHYKQKFIEISNDCLIEQSNLEAYLSDFLTENTLNSNDQIFKPLDIDIFPISNLRESIMLAVEEEIKYYDKLSKIVEELHPKDTRVFYAMALRKLGRINNIQYIFLRL